MYIASDKRYETMKYNRCGKSGLLLPAVSLGLWHNFGDTSSYANMEKLCFTAFDNGITHFDLANNYGPEPGSAEKNFGRIFKENFRPYRDEMIISTKAGYTMWEGPYGDWGSRKYLLASLDQSLKRMGLDYVDIFYHHRMDPNTPLEETMGALEQAVRSGKALYVGLSNYDGPTLEKAAAILTEMRVPFVINQNRYNILDRTVEKNGLKETAPRLGKGIICFTPLAQGVLTDRYLNGIPADSRVRTLSEWDSGGQPRAHGQQIPQGEQPDRGEDRARQGSQRDREEKGTDFGRDGARMDSQGWRSDVCADRRVQARADPRQHQGAGEHGIYSGGTGTDRRAVGDVTYRR